MASSTGSPSRSEEPADPPAGSPGSALGGPPPASGSISPVASSPPEALQALGEAFANGSGPSGSPPRPAWIRVVTLDDGACRELEGTPAVAELERAIRRPDCRIWIDLCGMSPELVGGVSRLLGLHPLLVEDLLERDQRAKLEQVDDVLHLVMFSLGFDDGRIYDRELDFVLGSRFLLTSHSSWWDPRTTRHLRMGIGEVLRRGPDFLLWAIADDVVDSYFPILDRLGDEIDDLENEVVGRADRALLERLFTLKRELIQVRRVTSPEREMFNTLSGREDSLITEAQRIYFRDAYDHLIRLTDELDTYRELVSATVEAYLSTVNNNLSLIMKRLTGVTVVVAGVGAVAGIFGMSEAQFAFRGDEGPGFWVITLGSLVLAALCVAVLRKIDWI